MRITLVCFNKLKTPGMNDSVAEFTKRISKYADLKIVELKSTQNPEKDAALIEESLAKLKSSGARAIWALDETGTAMRTEAWGSALTKLQDQAISDLVFLIGGSFGLSENTLKLAQKKVSFGPQTVSHELARLILVEQLYRALSMNAGHPYHKEG